MSFASSLFNATERRRRLISGTVLFAGALAAGACAGVYSLPAPRPLVVRSGARVFADRARLAEIDVWVREQQENIIVDPSFLIIENRSSAVTYPWQALTINGDTASVEVYAAAPESGSILSFYGYYHLMNNLGRLDEVLPEAVGAQGGVVQINFGSDFVSRAAHDWAMTRRAASEEAFGDAPPDMESRRAFDAQYRESHPYPFADLNVVLDHIDRVVALAGIDHVGLGSDFDGVGDTLPIGLKDVSDYPNLVEGLLERGYAADAIAQILGGNLMRVWRAVEEHVAARGNPPSCTQDDGLSD